MSTYRVIFQVARAGADFHAAVMRNVRNVHAELEDVTIRVIAHGAGIELVTGASAERAAVLEAVEAGVDVGACQNTLNRKGIPESELLAGVRVVPAGLAEIVRLQHEGWAYIHP